jgi:3-deoxy-D-manno-octulosonic-acid transferase
MQVTPEMESTRILDAGALPGGAFEDVSEPPAPLTSDANPGFWLGFLYWVYDGLWLAVLLVLSPWWGARALLEKPFRAMCRQRLARNTPRLPASGARTRFLVHGVSVGEIKATKSLVAVLRERGEVIITASTDTGMEVARQQYPDLHVLRFPLDPRWVIQRFINRLKPDIVVLMELEVWPNFLRVANKRGIPCAIVSGRITPSSVKNYSKFGRTLSQFCRITVFAAQNEEYARRFVELGATTERVVVTGNVKVDGLRVGDLPADGPGADMARWISAAPGQPVLVAGSTHDPEEDLVLSAFLMPALETPPRVILAPRHPPRAEGLVDELRASGVLVQRLTALRAGSEELDTARPLLVDTIGELDAIYAAATLAFIGGSLIEHGGQNMLEAAARGCPSLFGPHVDNFTQEAKLLIDAGAAVQVQDVGELASKVRELLGDAAELERMTQAGLAAVAAQGGATARTLRALERRCGVPLDQGC